MDKAAFVFDDVRIAPDRQIGLHSHPSWELSAVVCGLGRRTVGDLTEPITEGEVILIPPGIPHVWQFEPTHTDAEGNIANITVLFDTATLDGLLLVVPELSVYIERLKSLVEAVNLRGESRKRVYELLLSMRGLSVAARVPEMLRLLQFTAEADLSVSAGHNNSLNRMERRLDKVRTFCSCNFWRDITLDEVASYVGMNKSSFCTFMRRQAGMSLSQFVNDMRLDRAMDMLRHTDKTISDVAYDCGFANVTYFNRLFRNKYSCTPKSARQNSAAPILS